MSILVLGTVALDTVKTPFGRRKDMLGGSAAHFSMSARLFTEVHLVAVIGEDFPSRHVDFLKRRGIVLDSLIRSKGESFKWDGEYQGDMNSAITRRTQLGVLAQFKPELTEAQRKIRNVFLANIDPDIQAHFLSRMRSPSIVGLDSMNYWIHNKRKSLIKLLKRVDIYVANDQESRDLSGETNLLKAACSLRSLGPKFILIKKGEHGVILYSDRFVFSLPAWPARRVVDPTGAGDTFAGGFMGYLARAGRVDPRSLRSAISYGTVAASFNIEDFGLARTSRLKFTELQRRRKEFRNCILF